MTMATGGNSEAIFNEAAGIQINLLNYIREERLVDLQPHVSDNITSWH